MGINANSEPTVESLAEHRQAAGITQEQLARLAGCSTAYVRLVERGYTPDPTRSPAYARVMRALEHTG
jgi:predicted transcriptional regulator